MRHFLLSRPVVAHPGGVPPPATLARLIAPTSRLRGPSPRTRGAAVVALDLPSVAAPADDHLAAQSAHRNRRPDAAPACPVSRTRRRRTPSSAGYSSCIRVRDGVGHGVDTELAGYDRRRACRQVWQAVAGRSSPIPRLLHAWARARPSVTELRHHHNRAGTVTPTGRKRMPRAVYPRILAAADTPARSAALQPADRTGQSAEGGFPPTLGV